MHLVLFVHLLLLLEKKSLTEPMAFFEHYLKIKLILIYIFFSFKNIDAPRLTMGLLPDKPFVS